MYVCMYVQTERKTIVLLLLLLGGTVVVFESCGLHTKMYMQHLNRLLFIARKVKNYNSHFSFADNEIAQFIISNGCSAHTCNLASSSTTYNI